MNQLQWPNPSAVAVPHDSCAVNSMRNINTDNTINNMDCTDAAGNVRSPRHMLLAVIFVMFAFAPLAARATADAPLKQAASAVAQAAVPASSAIMNSTSTALSIGSIAQTVAALVFIAVLVLGCGCLARRFGLQRSRRAGLMRVVSSVVLGPKERVAIVEIGQTWVVVGTAPGSIRTLHVMPAGSAKYANTHQWY